MDFKLGNVKTGPAGGLKLDSINLAQESIKREKEEKQAAAKIEEAVVPGTLIYTVVGYPTFNCMTRTRKRINFRAGKYFVTPDAKDKEDIIDTLDYFVDQGILKSEKK